MSWRTYLDDVKGIGFWNYADMGRGGENLITSNVHDLVRDYSVVYNGSEGSIISSRRWEAFKLAVEDYEILCMYEQSFGKNATKRLVKEVIADPSDLGLADRVRSKMISEIVQATKTSKNGR